MITSHVHVKEGVEAFFNLKPSFDSERMADRDFSIILYKDNVQSL